MKNQTLVIIFVNHEKAMHALKDMNDCQLSFEKICMINKEDIFHPTLHRVPGLGQVLVSGMQADEKKWNALYEEFTDMGIPKDQSQRAEEEIRSGKTLIFIRGTEKEIEEAKTCFRSQLFYQY